MWKTIVKEKNVYCVVPGKQNDRYAQYRRVLEIEKPINDTKQIVVGISSRSDKIVLMNTISPCSVSDFIIVVIGCFNKKSNLNEVFRKEFHRRFTEIVFNFNGIIISVRKGNANFFDIYFEFKSKAKAKMGKYWRELTWTDGDDEDYY